MGIEKPSIENASFLYVFPVATILLFMAELPIYVSVNKPINDLDNGVSRDHGHTIIWISAWLFPIECIGKLPWN